MFAFRREGARMTVQAVENLLRLPYTIEVIRDESDGLPGYVARVVELPGCLTQAEDFQELGEMIEDAMRAWIETALEDGRAIPEPRPTTQYSGKFLTRVPKSLHRQLAEAAERDGVSLNNLVNVILARALGEQAISTPNRQSTPAWEYSRSPVRYVQVAESKDPI